ncbi:PDDEXK nuclease domain-containing protein [Algoriphagus sp. NG3]|uniref:PDDEXK nuclease domain-containing protein n=1 Tax=unclassified Algoriphagus TaxID=2641541 RepID=UPI002A840B42|nr:PDDEXK nuclease domain-containing protein [Algoriphagus sp. NG3]WPR75035.1 PDDEXK nuclease domain-containing protein [Algoriphagus sp. NG3]
MKDFENLLTQIGKIHLQMQAYSSNAVNQALTVRNWLIGFYIVEFELEGKDRAVYGEGLIDQIAQRLSTIKGLDRRSLFRFRTFYLYYPQIGSFLKEKVNPFLPIVQEIGGLEKVGTLTPQLNSSQIVGSASPQFRTDLLVPGEKLLSKLSYSHLELLIPIADQMKRTFYELETIKGIWSVRELKRNINSLLFERSGLSSDPEKMNKVSQGNLPSVPTDIIKNIYAFDFLNLSGHELIEESDLEQALINNLQDFILELGHGFCFEARQKRILIGENYYFIDLVFYHRVLKCHVLVELKIGSFEHGDLGQLNTYVNFFKQEISESSDNPPIGILLVAEKDHALVKYATGGMDQNLFIQQYLIKLPTKEKFENYLISELRKLS